MISLLTWINLIVALAFGICWGAMENRCWKEAGEGIIANHFKLYHVGMFVLFTWLNMMVANFTFGFTFKAAMLWVWLMMWDVLMLDVTWWIIRFVDFLVDPKAAAKYYNEPNMWHLRTDWDNWLGLPLISGIYWWWWVFAGTLGWLGAVIAVI